MSAPKSPEKLPNSQSLPTTAQRQRLVRPRKADAGGATTQQATPQAAPEAASQSSPQATPGSPFRKPLPPLHFPEELPVSSRREEITATLSAHQVVIVCGETGSGKTTQLPKICLAMGRGSTGLIGHTQPRRIAASSTAKRIAHELGSPLGEHVGYKVRFTDTLTRGAWIKLMTDGILLAETQTDPLLKQYDTIIIDEAHERSLNIDFLLGYLKQLLPRRPDLKIIITSATIDADRFARHFGTVEKPAPIIEVSGRLYPVEIRYRPIDNRDLASPKAISATSPSQNDRGQRGQRDLIEAVTDAVDELCRIGSGDVLVFLPGEREIRDVAEALRKHHPPHVEILPLFARLSAQEQERVFKSSNARRIVLATNVAETSLTVPGIGYVVDSGLARVKRYSYRNKVEQLQIEAIAQSAANQRAGRCGRVSAGVCIRLYDEQDYLLRTKFTEPEILRSSLAAVILRMKALHLTDVESFPFIEPPPGRAIADGYQLLQELGAVDEDNRLTQIGQQLAKLPLDPRIGRMILAARDHVCLSEMLILAAALSVQDPRDRPMDAQAAADLAHKKFADDRSEFLSYLKIWKWFEEAIAAKKTNRQLMDNCRTHFLSQVRLREWRDVHAQLLTIVREQNWRLNEAPATYEQLHLALLTGLLGNIGFKSEEDSYYLGARGIKFYLWPGSHLVKKAGKWLLAAELIDTTRLYARTVAQIQPEWLEKVGGHLLKKSFGEPRWEKSSAQVSAYERATLYGLVVYSQRRIHYGLVNPVEAREIFIRDALVGGDFLTRAPFFAHNQKLIREIENLEHKSRRLDVLVDDELIAAFYDRAIPAHICSGFTFEKWLKDVSADQPTLLYLNRDDLMRHEAAGVTTELFPKQLTIAGVEMTITYHFEPGAPRDGATLTVPLYALNQVATERCEWLVPGMLKDKVHLLIKSLPQKLRRQCVPIPDYAAGFCERVDARNDFGKANLIEVLIADIRTQTQVVVRATDFKIETLPAHHWMNFKIIDEHGRQLEMGRNLIALQGQFGGQARERFQRLAQQTPIVSESIDQLATPAITAGNSALLKSSPVATPIAATSGLAQYRNLTSWSFGVLPELLEISEGRQTLIGFPALVDQLTHCNLEIFDDAADASRIHHQGVRRLLALQLKEQLKYLEKNIPGLQQMGMQFMQLGSQEELRDQIITASLERSYMQVPLPKNAEEFNQRKELGKSRLGLLSNEIARLASQILTEHHGLSKKLQIIKGHPQASADIDAQMSNLIGKRFITDNDYSQLTHFPRYLKAIAVRIEKLKVDPTRDVRLMAEFAAAATPFHRAQNDRKNNRNDAPDMQQFRWLLEELRVSLFAQELRTPMPVSVKRLQKVWESMQR
jgi:ATP-dependent helicase HrpA